MALADAVGHADAKAFQMNRGMIDGALQEDLIYSQDGRPFIRNCRLRDRTGGVDVYVVRSAVHALYGFANEEELKQQIVGQSLTSCKKRSGRPTHPLGDRIAQSSVKAVAAEEAASGPPAVS